MHTKESCSYIKTCPMFALLSDSRAALYTHLFCQGYYYSCVRYRLRQTGATVPDNLLPYGGYFVSKEALPSEAEIRANPMPGPEE